MADACTYSSDSFKNTNEIMTNFHSSFPALAGEETTVSSAAQVQDAPLKNKAPQSRVSSTPRARFAILNAFNESNAQAAINNPVVPKKQEKPAQEPVVRKTKLDMLAEKYRDRAEERRKRGTEEDDEEEQDLDAEALRERRERSKYLGGSEETTHLVEGLDILLYERRKLEIELEEKRQKEAAARASEPSFMGAKQIVIDRHGHAKAVDAPQEFKTTLGRGIYNALFQKEAPPPIETFLPGRMTYIFPLNPESTQELPTIIERSMLSDAETTVNRDIRFEPFPASTSANALNKLSVVMSYLNQGESGIRRRKQELKEREAKAKAVIAETLHKLNPSASAAAAVPIDEDDEDIFGDVASTEYVPSVGLKESKEKKSMEGVLWDKVRAADSDGRQKGDLSAKRARESATSAQNSAMEVDEGSDDYEGFASGSDEEDIFAMDTGVRLKRSDFDNQEDYERYMSTREAIPKQAFGFGVKSADQKRKKVSTGAQKSKHQHALYKSVPGTRGSNASSES